MKPLLFLTSLVSKGLEKSYTWTLGQRSIHLGKEKKNKFDLWPGCGLDRVPKSQNVILRQLFSVHFVTENCVHEWLQGFHLTKKIGLKEAIFAYDLPPPKLFL